MLSDEEKEIFNNLKEYMQSNINKGYHKFIYNDLDWDFKCIDCINAIDKVLKQSKEIEELNLKNEKLYEDNLTLAQEIKEFIEGTNDVKYYSTSFIKNHYISKDKIKAKIEEYKKDGKIINQTMPYCGEYINHFEIKALQSLLEKE